jgi:dephospho-CoA kinase
MKRIALTGGIACGKSLLSSFLRKDGIKVIDADDIVHRLIPENERKKLAKKVFADVKARKELEARIHPLVKKEIDEFFSLYKPDEIRIAVIPLLFEVQWDKNFDIICSVVSSREKQIERMVTSRGYSREEAESRINAQMSVEEKAQKSHYVINNDSTTENLESEIRKFIVWLKNLMYSRNQ